MIAASHLIFGMGNSKYTISIRSGYVLVERVPGYEVVLEDQPAMLAAVSAACKDANCRNVLLMGPRTKVRLSPMDIFDLGKAIAKLDLKFAVVEIHDALDEDVDLLESVAFNRGGAIEFFDNEQNAKNWLGVA